MMEPRLTTGFWVSAYLARLRLADIPVFVTARGGTIRLGWVDATTLKPGRIPAPVLEALQK